MTEKEQQDWIRIMSYKSPSLKWKKQVSEQIDMSKYRSGGLTIPDHTKLGSYVYEPEISESQKSYSTTNGF